MAKLTPAQISALKDISIYDYLLQRGFKPTHRSGNSYFFDLSNSDKKTGETSVLTNTNRFHDFSGGIGGDIIQLVQHLDNVDFRKAVELLSSNTITQNLPTRKFDSVTKEVKKEFSFKAIDNWNKIDTLLSYAKSRGIDDFTIQNSNIQFIEDTENKYFYLALKNDENGFSVRNMHLKGVRGENNLTTIIHNPKGDFVVVEGMFEYLSILQITGNFNQNFVVLNSTSFADPALNFIKNNPENQFHIILNNDAAGIKAAETLAKASNTLFYNELIPAKSDLNQELLNNGLTAIKQNVSLFEAITKDKTQVFIPSISETKSPDFFFEENKISNLSNISPLNTKKMENTKVTSEKLDQNKKRELFENHLKENGAGGLKYDQLEKNYAERSQKPEGAKTSFLDDIVGKGMSDVFEFYVVVFKKGAEALLQTGKSFDDLLKSGDAKVSKKEGRIKMDLFKGVNGELEVKTLPITKQQELKRPEDNVIKMINYKASVEEISKLYDKRETVLIGEEGKKYYAKVDFKTNNIILKNQKSVSPNFVVKSILGTELSEEERTKLYEGKSIDIKVVNFAKKNGEVLNGKAKAQYDPITNSFNINKFYSNEMLAKFNTQNNSIADNLKKQYEAKSIKQDEKTQTPTKKQSIKKQ